MFNEGFYPTPAHVARKMLSPFSAGALLNRTILEPSAGKGDLCDAIRAIVEDKYPRNQGYGAYHNRWGEAAARIHCCEVEAELRATLSGKGYPVTAEDFLTFYPDEAYDLIVMNPPFANGEKHLLHAWGILAHGDIVCLLGAHTLNNPNTEARRLLCRIIEKHGKVEHLGSCFTDAFRKTDVEVVMISLKKEADPIAFELFGGCSDDKPGFTFAESGHESQVALRKPVENLVLSFDRARECYQKLLPLVAEMAFYTRQFAPEYGGEIKDSFQKSMDGLLGASTPESFSRIYNTFLRGLKRDAWQNVIGMTKARNLMSRKVAEDFDRQRDQMSNVAFTTENITTFLYTLQMNSGEILRRCVVEAFDIMTRFDKKNTSHVEGWKTNDAWRVNRKVIIPVVYRLENWETLVSALYKVTDKLNDIDRALAYLEGRKLENIYSIAQATIDYITPPDHSGKKDSRGVCRVENPDWAGTQYESEYFLCRSFKKGTIHLVFKNEDLWRRFNIEAAKGKNWLPDDYKHTEAAAQDGVLVPVG